MDVFRLKQDLYRLYRNVRLKAFYSTRPVINSGGSLALSISNLELRNKSTFIPPTTCAAAELFINRVEMDIKLFLNDQSKRDHIQNNLSQEEIAVLSSLSNKKEITIKPADKGGSIVIMDTAKYEGEIYRQLADTQIYKRLDSNPTIRVANKIKKVVKQAAQTRLIDNNTQTFLISDLPITPIFYVLPKIHKDPKNPRVAQSFPVLILSQCHLRNI